jgi:glutamate synthase (NADPH/NADH) small chain
MADINGFLKHERSLPNKRDVKERVNDYKEIYIPVDEEFNNKQAARCMDCGVPFCHNGCPLGNVIPDFNDAVFRKEYKEAYEILSSTNNFPEFTGRICPAPCEASCVLGINSDPVTIEHIEKSIIEEAFNQGWVKPNPPKSRTDKSVAVVGSGPAGMAAAVQLNKAGHSVTLFERNDKIGGLLRYGIPDFKLEKDIIDRRMKVMEADGIVFKTNTNIGIDINADELLSSFDAVVLTGGSTIPRDLPLPGRNFKGVHYAMEFLEQKNRQVSGQTEFSHDIISAEGKHVVVIGGGDTGADCVGTSNREKAKSVTQIELLAKPPSHRDETTPWPLWPMQLRTSTSHEEGCERQWSMLTKEFIADENGHVKALKIIDVEWKMNPEGIKAELVELEDTERIIDCDLVLLAVGFIHPQHKGILEQLDLKFDNRGNVQTKKYQTSVDKVFAAGDMRRGQSLVVWAITEGREAAIAVDKFLNDSSYSILESKNSSKLLV